MEADAARNLALQLMQQHGLRHWNFGFDRGRRRFGYCLGSSQKISLSLPLVLLNDETEVRDICLHEIAHALVGTEHGHDDTWKAKALAIGGSGNSGYISTAHGGSVRVGYRWQAQCPGCGHCHRRHNFPRAPRVCTMTRSCLEKCVPLVWVRCDRGEEQKLLDVG